MTGSTYPPYPIFFLLLIWSYVQQDVVGPKVYKSSLPNGGCPISRHGRRQRIPYAPPLLSPVSEARLFAVLLHIQLQVFNDDLYTSCAVLVRHRCALWFLPAPPPARAPGQVHHLGAGPGHRKGPALAWRGRESECLGEAALRRTMARQH